jgi:hypothetical protein
MEGRLANLGLLNHMVIAFLVYVPATARVLTWDQHPALAWSDFQGRARRNTGEPSAVTDTGFRVQLECKEGALDIRVTAEFYPSSSWVMQGRKSPELLHHEQGHFDITELYARKMRKAIRDAKISCEDEQRAEGAGKRIFEELDRAWEKAEKGYDGETKDGTDVGKQKGAVERIATALAGLRDYRL